MNLTQDSIVGIFAVINIVIAFLLVVLAIYMVIWTYRTARNTENTVSAVDKCTAAVQEVKRGVERLVQEMRHQSKLTTEQLVEREVLQRRRFKVKGRVIATGTEIKTYFSAIQAEDAQAQAEAKGIRVESVEPAPETE